MILIALYTGSRAFTVGQLLWSDITQVAPLCDMSDLGSDLVSITINSRVVKMSLNGDSESTFVGYIHDRRMGDFDLVYLLNQFAWVTWNHGLTEKPFSSPEYNVPLFSGENVCLF